MMPTRRSAYTLVELMVSLAMFALVALALQSAVLLACKAVPDSKSTNVAQLSATRAADRFNSELACALSVSELSATAVTFTVADRDGDAAVETIRYAWSGVAGEPLTRSYNGGTAVSVLDDCREFALSYDKRSQKNAATYTESGETLLYSFTGGVLGSTSVIKNDEWCGQYFVPTLPNGAVYWRVTRVRFQAQKHSSADGIIRLQLRTATAGGLPTTTVVDQTQFPESVLDSNFTWEDINLTGNATLDPASGACVVFRWVADAEACDIQAKTLSLALGSGAKFVSTTNSGSTWGANALKSMLLYVYGVSATQNADTYSYFLTGVRAQLRQGTDASARVNTGIGVLSEPQVAGP